MSLHDDVAAVGSPMAGPIRPRVLGPGDGPTRGQEAGVRDRFMVSGAESGGGFSLVEHLLAPRALAAPLHRHGNEDEYSYVLEGSVGAILAGEEVRAGAGDLIFKPRDEWHTFWNAGDAPARVLEIISPGGFEQAFHAMHDLEEDLTPAAMTSIAVSYGVEVDFEGTGPIIERHDLSF